jgi:hypothetical protein
MEHLESKYFERVTAALKQARDSQKIEMNEDFRRSLRARLEQRALLFSEQPAEPSWVEWVLRSRYLLGGVPVMAALVLVTMAALNHNVPLDSQMLAETGQTGEQKKVETEFSTEMPVEEPTAQSRLVTFSAELVMPPAEVLAAREAQLKGETVWPELPAETTVSSESEYYFWDGSLSSVLSVPLFENEQPAVTASQLPTEVAEPQVVQVPPSEQTIVTMVRLIEPVNQNVSPEQTTQSIQPMPPEANGRLTDDSSIAPEAEPLPAVSQPVQEDTLSTEDAATVFTQPVTSSQPELTTIANQTVVQEQQLPQNSEIVPVSSVQVPDAYIVVDPAAGTFEKIEATELNVETADSQPEESILPINLDSFQPVSTDMQVSEVDNQLLLAERIYFRGELREKLVRAVMLALAGRDGTLSRDYYVNIVAFPDNTYRATLYEHGNAKTLLVIGDQRGEYRVITQVNY